MTYFEQVLQRCVGKTVAEAGTVRTEDGDREGVRLTFTDGTVVQFVYDMDEQDFLAQEVEG